MFSAWVKIRSFANFLFGRNKKRNTCSLFVLTKCVWRIKAFEGEKTFSPPLVSVHNLVVCQKKLNGCFPGNECCMASLLIGCMQILSAKCNTHRAPWAPPYHLWKWDMEILTPKKILVWDLPCVSPEFLTIMTCTDSFYAGKMYIYINHFKQTIEKRWFIYISRTQSFQSSKKLSAMHTDVDSSDIWKLMQNQKLSN